MRCTLSDTLSRWAPRKWRLERRKIKTITITTDKSILYSGVPEGQLLPNAGGAPGHVRPEPGRQLRRDAPDDRQPLLRGRGHPHLHGLGRLPAQGCGRSHE